MAVTRSIVAFLSVFIGAAGSVVAGPLPPANTGHFYVSNFQGDNVVVVDNSGTVTRRFSDPDLDGPRGIVIGPSERIFVAAQRSNAIVIFDTDENCVDTFTDPQLVGPTGLAFGRGGVLYACSSGNDRIVAFDPDGTLAGSFTARGLKGPACIATDGNTVFVAGPASPWIFRFGSDGTPRRWFTGGGLSSPAGIALAGGLLYVADRGTGRVVVLDRDGTVQAELSHPDLAGPQGLAFDDRRHLFVSCCFRDWIVEFDSSGRYVRTIAGGQLSFPGGVAFSSMPRGDVDDDCSVGLMDFGEMLAGWGDCPAPPTGCRSDTNRDGRVDVGDLFILLANWD